MGKWLNGARVRRREIDGKDTRIAALAAAGAAQIAGQVPVATAGLFAPALPAWSRAQATRSTPRLCTMA